MSAPTPLWIRLEKFVAHRREKSLLGVPTVLKIHPRDAKEAASWDMEFTDINGNVYPIEVLGDTMVKL